MATKYAFVLCLRTKIERVTPNVRSQPPLSRCIKMK